MQKQKVSFMVLLALSLSCACCTPFMAESPGAVGSNGNSNSANRQNTLLSVDASGGNTDLDNMAESSNSLSGGGNNGNSNQYDKRVERYAFGLGRRAYMYSNGGAGMKRLPVYNFGLGKRAAHPPYSFGLGKRAGGDYDELSEYDLNNGGGVVSGSSSLGGGASNEYDRYNGNNYNNAPGYELNEKRDRQYSFGLGKRERDEVERRFPNRYGFGLGRR